MTRPLALDKPRNLLNKNEHQAGFTLVEVLVAIAITSIALLAGLRAAIALINNSARQSNMLLAHICAENELTSVRLSRSMPVVGNRTKQCEQAGRIFTVSISVVATANAEFHRVDVRVLHDAEPLMALWTLVGQY